MPADIWIHTPPIASSNIERDLCVLTEHLARVGHNTAHGVLGGEWGYGADYDGPVFEMHPFWWGDCECGHETLEMEWLQQHPHADECYQAELERRDWQEPEKLAAEWELPRYGCAVHCTCGRDNAYQRWMDENPHPRTCPEMRPNFRHKPSGLEIRWYKWIGRSMEYLPAEPTPVKWRALFAECVVSLAPAARDDEEAP